MRIKIPLTGTLLTEEPYIGDGDDPVRIIELDLGDLSWEAVAWDWERELVEIDVEPAPRYVGRVDDQDNPIPDETPAEYKARRAYALEHVRWLLLDHTVEELREMSGSPSLRRPFRPGGGPPEG